MDKTSFATLRTLEEALESVAAQKVPQCRMVYALFKRIGLFHPELPQS